MGQAETSAATPPAQERRWVTVLFADLSGFTSLSEDMDPEDVMTLAQGCVERFGEHISRFGGTVLREIGDEVFAVFGAPLAHEDDAERAVRAALAIRDSTLGTVRGQALRAHIGINTGEVMAGLVGLPGRREYTLHGDVVNTAARLRSSAGAGTVLVGEETYRATRQLVRFEEMAAVEAKGKEHPLRAWAALEVESVPRARTLGTAPLVGRDDELALLSGTWAKVMREARPHLVALVGDPGIGKSRLTAEFEQRVVAQDQARVLHGRCLPYGEALGYWAIAEALKEAAGVASEDDAPVARAKLASLVERALGAEAAADTDEVTRHLALLSGLDTAADHDGGPVEQRNLHASARRFFEALARSGPPVCLIFEDLHWADDALLDLVEFVAARAHDAPLLLLGQARPELLDRRPGLGRGVRAFTTLSLEPLPEEPLRDLLRALGRERGVSSELVEQIGRGSGGNPLFAEELVAMLAERGAVQGVPSAIKALISSRLDGLPMAERRTAQLAAVFGRVFWESGVRALAGADVMDELEALLQKDLIREMPGSTFRGDREYTFKHDLIRDVAYEVLPRAERRRLHAAVADWIEQTVGGGPDDYLDVLAHHAVQADQDERAIGYLRRASERARRAALHRQEAGLLGQAIGIAERLERAEVVAELRVRRGHAYTSLVLPHEARLDLEAGLAAMGTEPTEQRAELLTDLVKVCFWALDIPALRQHAPIALALAEQLGRADLVAEVMSMLASADGAEGDLPAAINYFQRTLAGAAERGIPPPAMLLPNYAINLYWTGRVPEALERSRMALRVARDASHVEGTMTSLAQLGLALGATGQYAEAIQVFDEARRFGHDYGAEPLLARCIAMSAGMYLDVFDFAGHQALAEEARDLARSANFPPALVSAGIDLLLNFARTEQVGRADALVDEVAAAVERASGFHGWLWRLRLAEARAELHLARGAWPDALLWAEQAVEQSQQKGRVKYQVAGLGTRAAALAALGRHDAAVANLREAVALARPVGDPALFVRSAAALLALDSDDALAAEARVAVERIAAALPTDELRQRFETAAPLRQLR